MLDVEQKLRDIAEGDYDAIVEVLAYITALQEKNAELVEALKGLLKSQGRGVK